jgi:hypothetical protein
MKWVEIISLRCSGNIDPRFIDELLKGLSGSDSPTDTPTHLVDIKVYQHSVVETDLSICIHWKSESGSYNKSPLGMRISSALKPLGLLNHSVWFETAALKFPQVVETTNPGAPRNGMRRKTLERMEESKM